MVKRHIHRLLRSLPMRRCCASRSPPRSARTTSSWARRSRSCSKRIPPSPSCTMPRRMRWCCGDKARCNCAWRPSGCPIVDITAKLVDGSYHTVDSSDMAFQLAGRLAIHEGLPQCQPVLLEPIYQVEIVCPSEATAKMNGLMSGRRGQILGFDTREGWDGWDVVRLQMPESEIGDLIVEVRSATAGVGSFTFKFDHMAELVGRNADQIVAARKTAAA